MDRVTIRSLVEWIFRGLGIVTLGLLIWQALHVLHVQPTARAEGSMCAPHWSCGVHVKRHPAHMWCSIQCRRLIFAIGSRHFPELERRHHGKGRRSSQTP